MKKILLLGGSAQQVVAIKTAKQMGYKTILCDYLSDNPGKAYADKYYTASTTDMDEVLKIAKQENIDGILAYASDPAAPTAAYVAEQLGLPTNPYKAVETLCNKDKFRAFLKKNSIPSPVSCVYDSAETAISEMHKYQFPVIIKPVDSSGSKGISVVRSMDHARKYIDDAFNYSRRQRIIIEDFIEKNHEYIIGGDIFVVNGQVIIWGLLNCHRDNKVNPLVPTGKSYPLQLDECDIERIKHVLQDIVHKLGFMNGAINVELMIDRNNRVIPIDIGPRCGGNMIPEFLGYIYNINIVELLIKIAMGIKVDVNIKQRDGFYATYNLHVSQNGRYVDTFFSGELTECIIKKNIYKKSGDDVYYFDNASKVIGIIFMKFKTLSHMMKILNNIDKHVDIRIN